VNVDTSSPVVRDYFAAIVRAQRDARDSLLRRLAIDLVAVTTDTGYMHPLLRFFRAREARRIQR
jgi:hypothetical protein